MYDSVRPHRWQPARLPHPWDSPGKNTGVGCHFLLQCMKVKSESEVIQSFPILWEPMDCGLPGSSIHGISQARVLDGMPLPYPTLNSSDKISNPNNLESLGPLYSFERDDRLRKGSQVSLTLGHIRVFISFKAIKGTQFGLRPLKSGNPSFPHIIDSRHWKLVNQSLTLYLFVF